MNFENWRKSTYSASGSNQCVEVGTGPGLVGVRDTTRRAAGQLAVNRKAWSAFVRHVAKQPEPGSSA